MNSGDKKPNQSTAANRWPAVMTGSQHVYEVRPRKDHRGVDLISDALPFGRLWYGEPNAIRNAIGCAEHRSRSHHAVIRVYDCSWQRDCDARTQRRFQRVVTHSLRIRAEQKAATMRRR